MSDHFPITIFHNPACGTSRNTLAMIEAAGYRPTVIDYLNVGWAPDQLVELARRMGAPLRALIREKGAPAAALALLEPSASEASILAAMVEHPILVNRPIVVTPMGVALCRPSERVFDILANRPARFTKEDGETVIFE